MAEYVLQLAKQEQITLPAAVADKLIRQSDGDAALLYLLLLRHHGRIGSADVMKELRFSAERCAAAEKTLGELGLLGEKQWSLLPQRKSPPTVSWRSRSVSKGTKPSVCCAPRWKSSSAAA